MGYSSVINLFKFIHQELGRVFEEYHHDSLEERTWHCEPLLVIGTEETVLFSGDLDVTVRPLADGTADFTGAIGGNGYRPTLSSAIVESVAYGGGHKGGSRNGVECQGIDQNGDACSWYINGAADNYVANLAKMESGVFPLSDSEEENER